MEIYFSRWFDDSIFLKKIRKNIILQFYRVEYLPIFFVPRNIADSQSPYSVLNSLPRKVLLTYSLTYTPSYLSIKTYSHELCWILIVCFSGSHSFTRSLSALALSFFPSFFRLQSKCPLLQFSYSAFLHSLPYRLRPQFNSFVFFSAFTRFVFYIAQKTQNKRNCQFYKKFH